MKFVPPGEINEENNVNVTRVSPLSDMLILLGGALLSLIVLYVLLGFFADYVAQKLPASVEEKLGSVFENAFDNKVESESEKKIKKLINELILPGEKRKFKVAVVNEDQVNAMAIPGGTIVIYSKLIEQTQSENELAFVLGHEMGHFAYRDHLRGLGRSLVLMAISVTILGSDGPASSFLNNSITKVEMKFSQNQESRADFFALDVLYKKYGHVGGATDFFEKISREDKSSRFASYFATHPNPASRINSIKEEAKKRNYQFKSKIPLDKAYKNF